MYVDVHVIRNRARGSEDSMSWWCVYVNQGTISYLYRWAGFIVLMSAALWLLMLWLAKVHVGRCAYQ